MSPIASGDAIFEEMEDLKEDIEKLVLGGLRTDGAHHKQWYLEEIGRLVGIDVDKHRGFDWEEGM